MPKLTHINRQGAASMVDVSTKPAVRREAVAEGRIVLQPATLSLIRKNQVKKGDVLSIARIAAIQAAKQTQHLIPLCHQIPLSKVQIEFELHAKAVHITATALTVAPTGVEMEALTAVSVAALTIYDMCKAADKKMRIEGVRLVSKTKG
ncbi:cyclic pyranopterin monophosphate synthase MoaC [Prosthecobacter sp.]|uniref:cyclic pyranopterin monophosphate synthase MoaC n=1 Tax=Prosthecobacter sp. TaxID=1965333 RepID=UPI001D892FDB|nr:cyclic pyranopterin monophosphate synthase MoaC [Prosthecobacter sp.]MCB1277888.1 cyclic pyranopterin monophosphate synthase MoaC [Prosthecobacter sp.]